jgi:hypothetical protein
MSPLYVPINRKEVKNNEKTIEKAGYISASGAEKGGVV